MDIVTKELKNLGYAFRPNFSSIERFYFIAFLRDSEEEKRRYHLHLTHLESGIWKEMIAFRDSLRVHPEDAALYAQSKKEAARQANGEGEKYREFKEPFFKKALKKHEILGF